MDSPKKQSWASNGLRRQGRWLKELTYREGFLKVVRRLPFAKALRNGYLWLAGGGDNILRVKVGESEVLFRVQSPREYRGIESSFLGKERFFLDILAHELREGDVFLDVGSARGEFAIPMAKVVGSGGLVIAVEPEINAYTRLKADVRLNGFTNVRLFRTALSDQCGEAKLWCDGACPTLFRAPSESAPDTSNLPPVPSGSSELVIVDVGDLMMDREHLPIPKAVKIDVEGFEYNVIRGLTRTLRDSACKLICCEIHPPALPRGITAQAVIDEVKSLGFQKATYRDRSGQVQMVACKG